MSLLSDMEELRQATSSHSRVTIAEKISRFFNHRVFKETEEQISTDILRLLTRDTEVRVRAILSQNLKENSYLPHDIALKLAQDIAEVSAPMLEFSEVLTEDDLIEIVRSTEEIEKLKPVARRRVVSSNLSSELISKQYADVTLTLVSNNGATLSEGNYLQILESCKSEGRVLEALVQHGRLPISIAERMVHLVSDALKQELAEKYHINKHLAEEIILDTREDAVLDVLSRKGIGREAKDLVEHLHQSRRLTHSIIMRALCKGDLAFFEAGLAKMAGIPVSNAKQLIIAENPKAFESLYYKAHMPKSTYEAIRVILNFVLESDDKRHHHHVPTDEAAYSRHLLERITDGGYDKSLSVMRYLMALVESRVSLQDTMLH